MNNEIKNPGKSYGRYAIIFLTQLLLLSTHAWAGPIAAKYAAAHIAAPDNLIKLEEKCKDEDTKEDNLVLFEAAEIARDYRDSLKQLSCGEEELKTDKITPDLYRLVRITALKKAIMNYVCKQEPDCKDESKEEKKKNPKELKRQQDELKKKQKDLKRQQDDLKKASKKLYEALIAKDFQAGYYSIDSGTRTTRMPKTKAICVSDENEVGKTFAHKKNIIWLSKDAVEEIVEDFKKETKGILGAISFANGDLPGFMRLILAEWLNGKSDEERAELIKTYDLLKDTSTDPELDTEADEDCLQSSKISNKEKCSWTKWALSKLVYLYPLTIPNSLLSLTSNSLTFFMLTSGSILASLLFSAKAKWLTPKHILRHFAEFYSLIALDKLLNFTLMHKSDGGLVGNFLGSLLNHCTWLFKAAKSAFYGSGKGSESGEQLSSIEQHMPGEKMSGSNATRPEDVSSDTSRGLVSNGHNKKPNSKTGANVSAVRRLFNWFLSKVGYADRTRGNIVTIPATLSGNKTTTKTSTVNLVGTSNGTKYAEEVFSGKIPDQVANGKNRKSKAKVKKGNNGFFAFLTNLFGKSKASASKANTHPADDLEFAEVAVQTEDSVVSMDPAEAEDVAEFEDGEKAELDLEVEDTIQSVDDTESEEILQVGQDVQDEDVIDFEDTLNTSDITEVSKSEMSVVSSPVVTLATDTNKDISSTEDETIQAENVAQDRGQEKAVVDSLVSATQTSDKANTRAEDGTNNGADAKETVILPSDIKNIDGMVQLIKQTPSISNDLPSYFEKLLLRCEKNSDGVYDSEDMFNKDRIMDLKELGAKSPSWSVSLLSNIIVYLVKPLLPNSKTLSEDSVFEFVNEPIIQLLALPATMFRMIRHSILELTRAKPEVKQTTASSDTLQNDKSEIFQKILHLTARAASPASVAAVALITPLCESYTKEWLGCTLGAIAATQLLSCLSDCKLDRLTTPDAEKFPRETAPERLRNTHESINKMRSMFSSALQFIPKAMNTAAFAAITYFGYNAVLSAVPAATLSALLGRYLLLGGRHLLAATFIDKIYGLVYKNDVSKSPTAELLDEYCADLNLVSQDLERLDEYKADTNKDDK